MNKGLTLLGATSFGVGLMYFLDPDLGRRRRALAKDQANHFLNKASRAIGPLARDVEHRAQGVLAEGRAMFEDEEVSDDVLVARVRSAIGRVTSHAGAIQVDANEGRVTLSGPVLAAEEKGIVRCAADVRGVTDVESRLERHETAEGVPSLQGGNGTRGSESELFQRNWSPTARFLTGVAGGAMAVYGMRRRGVGGALLSTVGVGLLARGISNMELSRLTGVEAGRRDMPKAVDLEEDRDSENRMVAEGSPSEERL